MARFKNERLPFGLAAPQADGKEEDGTPRPHIEKAKFIRLARLTRAREVIEHLPGPNESLHAITTARMDLTDLITAIIERRGRCDSLRIATLGYNLRNLNMILEWLDVGSTGRIVLIASKFFRAHNGDLWEQTQSELARRGSQAACCDSHAKVVTLAFADGERWSIEGSANLCGNGSGREGTDSPISLCGRTGPNFFRKFPRGTLDTMSMYGTIPT